MAIHPTAIIDPDAELDTTVEVGAYAIIEGGTQIGAATRIFSHGLVQRGARIGRRCRIHAFAVMSGVPQDRSFDGAESYAVIGDDTVLRECATLHRGTEPQSTTAVGQRCLLMSSTHVGHNCQIDDDVTISQGTVLGGRVVIERGAIVGGMCGIHQFCRIGELAMVAGGNLRVTHDIPPFMTVLPEGLVGPNVVGLRRAEFSIEERNEIRECYRTLFRSGLTLRRALDLIDESVQTAPGRRLVDFLRVPAKRAIAKPARRRSHGSAETDDA